MRAADHVARTIAPPGLIRRSVEGDVTKNAEAEIEYARVIFETDPLLARMSA